MAIQVRRGNEADFDASKMLPGEWAVSLDTRYVRMCFAPGIVLRMATYEGFEADKAQFQAILAECRSIQEVVQRIGSEVSEKASLTIEYSNSAKKDAERAKLYADKAEAVTGVNIATQDRAGLVKGGDNYIAEDGTLTLIKQTAETTMPNSYSGRLKVEEIGGESEQFTTTGKNLLDCSGAVAQTINEVTFTPEFDNSGLLQYINVNGTATSDAKFTLTRTFSVTEGIAYTASGCPSGGSTSTYYFAVGKVGSDIGSGITNTPTVSSADNYVQIVVKSGKTASNLKFYPMVRLASVTDATYEPYTGGIPSPNPSYPQEIKKTVVSEVKTHGVNFLDISAMVETTAEGVTFTPQPDGGIRVKGTATAQANYYLVGNRTAPQTIDGIEENSNIYIKFKTAVGICYVRYVSGDVSANIGKDSVVEYASDCKIILRVGTGAVVDETIYVMVSKDADATYEPYTESVITLSQPIDLYGRGDVQDIITPKQIKRKYVSVDFDGSADEDLRQDSTYMFRIPLTQKGVAYGENQLCTRLKRGASYSAIQKTENTFGVSGVALILHIEGVTSIDELRAWLVEHPMTVVYEMLEETTEELPIADQVALNSLSTYDGITYLEFDSEIEPTFKGEYGTSKVGGYTLEGMLAGRNGELLAKSYTERINALEASVVNNI